MSNAADWVPGSVDQVKAAYGVPADAAFLGYVVHLRASDEFLVSAQKFPRQWRQGKLDGVARMWSKHPALAKVFKDHQVAQRIANDCAPGTAEVVHLFDTENQLFVAIDG